jgi:hypothetical protein
MTFETRKLITTSNLLVIILARYVIISLTTQGVNNLHGLSDLAGIKQACSKD